MAAGRAAAGTPSTGSDAAPERGGVAAPGDVTSVAAGTTSPREVQVAADAGVSHAASGRPNLTSGPFTTRQLLRIDEALTAADAETGLTFSVYVGPLDEPTRAHAERLHDQLADPESAVLLAISPNQRLLEIVTGGYADRRLPRQICALAALSMTASFGGGDLAGGIVTGLRMLADQARGRAGA